MKKGMTFITAGIAVVIMLILATTATVAIVNVSNDTTLTKFATEIAYVQEAVNNYHDKNNEYPVNNSVSVDLSQVNARDKVQFNLEEVNDNTILLYEIDYSKLGNIEIVYGNKSDNDLRDIYAVSKNTGKVYYLKGVKVGSTVYFTLNDTLKERISYVDTNEDTVTKDGISFIPSTNKWTNLKITTRVLVPNKYTDIVVSTINSSGTTSTITTNFEVESFLEYRVESITGNYSINVSYKNTNGDSLKQTYSVSNYDNVAPTASVSDRVDVIPKDGEDGYSYIKVSDVNDNLSGIKTIKYERELISSSDAPTYFRTNGIELQGDIIEVKEKSTAEKTRYVTIYIEDNAGNYRYISVDV